MKTKKIQILPPQIANQISAGEVIERPASVVKELLENALDAQATQITVELSYAGLNSIIISDNGVGIDEADLPLAIFPHATSKITSLSDLESISSLGFRGEALASIASVSRLCIQSKPAHQPEAMQLSVADEDVQISVCARNTGTTIECRDLFYNAPVRKRFLKSERTEFLAIDKLVRCFALSAQHVGIRLIHNGQLVFSLPIGATEPLRLQRVQKVLGKAFIDAAIPVNTKHEGLDISGWITEPEYARSQQDRVWLYVNQRMVNDKLLNHAVKQAYEGRLHPGRYPGCVLYLELDPQAVDVNVHPTKHELRFHDPRSVHDALRSVVEGALMQEQPQPEKKVINRARSHVVPTNDTAARWILLSKGFAVLFFDESPFLVDIRQMQQDRLRQCLRESELPLQQRPLLLPVSISLNPEHMIKLELVLPLFAQAGLSVSWFGESVLLVRTLPSLLPQLAIKPFVLAALKLGVSSFESLSTLFVQFHEETLQLTSSFEQKEWALYLQACSPEQQHRVMRPLSDEVCKALFVSSEVLC